MIIRRTIAHHLFSHLNDSLQRESPSAVVEEIFQRGAKQIDHEDIVKTLLTEIVDIRNTGCAQMVSYRCDTARHERKDSRQPTRILYVLYSSRN